MLERFLSPLVDDIRTFDRRSLALIEPLRAMRILYFLAWRCRQVNDPGFRNHFPELETHNFWYAEIAELERQYSLICDVAQ